MARFSDVERKAYRQTVLNNIKNEVEEAKKRIASGDLTNVNAINHESGTAYSGNNALVLSLIAAAYFKGVNEWLTFPQIKAMGGNVKGQKGAQITKILESEIIGDDGKTTVKKGLKIITVFNIKQVQGITLKPKTAAKKTAKTTTKKTEKKTAVKPVKAATKKPTAKKPTAKKPTAKKAATVATKKPVTRRFLKVA